QVLAGLEGAELGVVDQVAHHGHERLVQRRTPSEHARHGGGLATGRLPRVTRRQNPRSPACGRRAGLWTAVRRIRTAVLANRTVETALSVPGKSVTPTCQSGAVR